MSPFKSAVFTAIAAVASYASVYEAEDIEGINDIATVVDSVSMSGGKYVKASSGITFTVNAEVAAIYDIVVNTFVIQYDWFNTVISVNGVDITNSLTNAPNGNTSYSLEASAKLNAGKNTIKISGGTINCDYISIERHPDVTFNISATPVTPGATLSAQKLKTFMRDNFTKKTISGMMIGSSTMNYHYGETTESGAAIPESNYLIVNENCETNPDSTCWKMQEDIATFKTMSGYYPALSGFDMLFASGKHSDEGWFLGYTEQNIAMAKELWNYGGIPAFTWHWKVGTDSVFYTQNSGFKNASCTDGVVATASNNTCFNYTKAFKDEACSEIDESSKEYALIINDVDKVSTWFLKLQEDDVAILWRPLHEAAGGWFWWGVGSATCYKALYRLVFDRMVSTNGVKNALWIWNIERDPSIGYDVNALNPDWYPGDAYVDIIGVDIYNNASDHKSNVTYFNKIVNDIGTSKIIALTENGPIPDVDSTFEDNAVWSYWMSWYNTWDSGFLRQTSTDVWQKNLADDRILKLETMPGWAAVTADTSGEGAVIAPSVVTKASIFGAEKATLYMQGNTLSIYLSSAKNVHATLLNAKGRIIATFNNVSANGVSSFDLSNLSHGTYFVKVQADGVRTAQKITVK